MEKGPEASRPPTEDISAVETDVEAPRISTHAETSILPTWRLVCVCIR